MDIETVGDLCDCTDRRLYRSKSVGGSTLQEIRGALARHGLTLRGEADGQFLDLIDDLRDRVPPYDTRLATPIADKISEGRLAEKLRRLGVRTYLDLLDWTEIDLWLLYDFDETEFQWLDHVFRDVFHEHYP